MGLAELKTFPLSLLTEKACWSRVYTQVSHGYGANRATSGDSGAGSGGWPRHVFSLPMSGLMVEKQLPG